MSFRALAWVAELRDVTWSERGVLTKLANYANEHGGSIFPSVQTISKWADVDERTIRRILNRLLQRRLIEVVGANGRTGGKHPTSYRIIIPKAFMPRDDDDAEGPAPRARNGGAPVSPDL